MFIDVVKSNITTPDGETSDTYGLRVECTTVNTLFIEDVSFNRAKLIDAVRTWQEKHLSFPDLKLAIADFIESEYCCQA